MVRKSSVRCGNFSLGVYINSSNVLSRCCNFLHLSVCLTELMKSISNNSKACKSFGFRRLFSGWVVFLLSDELEDLLLLLSKVKSSTVLNTEGKHFSLVLRFPSNLVIWLDIFSISSQLNNIKSNILHWLK